MEVTTIKLSKVLKQKLDEIKIHPRETYEEVIWRLLKEIYIIDTNEKNN